MDKFVKAAQSKNMLKVVIGGKETWAFCSEPVLKFAKNTLKEGDEVTIQSDNKNGNIYITRISKGEVVSIETPKTEKPVSESPRYVCEDCGKELKDGKYKKCYECNKKNPEPKEKKEPKTTYGYTPKDTESIKKQAVLKSVCMAVSALTGMIDINNLGDVIENLYDRFLKKLG